MFTHTWVPATATIVARKYKEGGERSGSWVYVADVTSPGGATFRAKLEQPTLMQHVIQLVPGETVQVFADVKHLKVKFDKADPKVSGSDRRTDSDAFRDALAQAPSTPPPDSLR